MGSHLAGRVIQHGGVIIPASATLSLEDLLVPRSSQG
jgi:hypothetical protein